jgi:hypothetical protein
VNTRGYAPAATTESQQSKKAVACLEQRLEGGESFVVVDSLITVDALKLTDPAIAKHPYLAAIVHED